ncbi:MAG: hypothetical protein ABIU09_06205 [Pyrinomonadaceae bacterium]
MNEQQEKEYWQKVRSKGIVRFTVENIILGIAIPSVVLTQTIIYLLEYGFTAAHISEFATITRICAAAFGVLVVVAVFLLAYWVFGKNKLSKSR